MRKINRYFFVLLFLLRLSQYAQNVVIFDSISRRSVTDAFVLADSMKIYVDDNGRVSKEIFQKADYWGMDGFGLFPVIHKLVKDTMFVSLPVEVLDEVTLGVKRKTLSFGFFDMKNRLAAGVGTQYYIIFKNIPDKIKNKKLKSVLFRTSSKFFLKSRLKCKSRLDSINYGIVRLEAGYIIGNDTIRQFVSGRQLVPIGSEKDIAFNISKDLRLKNSFYLKLLIESSNTKKKDKNCDSVFLETTNRRHQGSLKWENIWQFSGKRLIMKQGPNFKILLYP